MRQRKSYPKSFKAQVVHECEQPGVSVAAIAMRHGINANVVRRWIAGAESQAASSNICVEIQHPRGTVKVNWPTDSAAACATFLRDLLR
ncbi:transposase [Pseudomonas sp. P4795]|uniref:transposase n=1 Tax=Pseudomonas sp. P4795 TaxID=3409915 RepID=UPI003B5AC3B7